MCRSELKAMVFQAARRVSVLYDMLKFMGIPSLEFLPTPLIKH
jgi:hypothetical protein